VAQPESIIEGFAQTFLFLMQKICQRKWLFQNRFEDYFASKKLQLLLCHTTSTCDLVVYECVFVQVAVCSGSSVAEQKICMPDAVGSGFNSWTGYQIRRLLIFPVKLLFFYKSVDTFLNMHKNQS